MHGRVFGAISMPRVIDTVMFPKMLYKTIFSGKFIYAYVSRAVRTWELGGLIPVSLEVIKAPLLIFPYYLFWRQFNGAGG